MFHEIYKETWGQVDFSLLRDRPISALQFYGAGQSNFFQVLFGKTCSMKFVKRPGDRWILASSGTVPFRHHESTLPVGVIFFQVLFEKTCSMKFAKRLGDRWILASSGTVPFRRRESTLPVRIIFFKFCLKKRVPCNLQRDLGTGAF